MSESKDTDTVTNQPSEIAAEAEGFRKTDKSPIAERRIRMCVEHYPWYAPGKMILSHLLIEKGEFPEAEQVLVSLLQAEPVHGPALKLLGELYLRLDEPENARRCFEKAQRTSPDNLELNDLLLDLTELEYPATEIDSGILEEIRSFETSASGRPDNFEDSQTRGRNRGPDADPVLDNHQDNLENRDDETRNNNTVTLARIYLKQGYYVKAREILARLDATKSGDPDLEQLREELKNRENDDSSWNKE